MKRLLIVIDMQNDFVSGALGTPEAVSITGAVAAKVQAARAAGALIIFTRDTHYENYLETLEGRLLPVVHCIKGTPGRELCPAVAACCKAEDIIIDKPTFGSLELAERLGALVEPDTVIELCGLCTDICVVSNALILRAAFPNNALCVDPACCAGVSVQKHEAALEVMKSCQIEVIE